MQVADAQMHEADACVAEDQEMLGRTIATVEVVGHHRIGREFGQIAIDEHHRYAARIDPRDGGIILFITDWKDDQPRHTIFVEAFDVAGLLRRTLLGVRKADLVAA